MDISIFKICDVINGKIISWRGNNVVQGGNCLIHGLKKGDLYFPWGINTLSEIRGYVHRHKLAGVVWDKTIPKGYIEKLNLIKVDNIEEAYIRFATYYRSLFDLPIIAVTGSAGKTTVKELTAAILASHYKTLKGHENFNIAPLNCWNISRLNEKHEIAVLETAMTTPGSIKAQCDIIKPTVGIITCIGVDHYAEHNDEDSIIQTKGELINELPVDGYLILNADDEKSQRLDCSSFSGQKTYFGIKNSSDFQAEEAEHTISGIRFTAKTPLGNIPIESSLIGTHNVYNILAALAVGSLFNIPPADMSEAIKNFTPLMNRLQVLSGYNGSYIINDTFSANPNSMASAIDTVNKLALDKEKIAVIAPMYLLGDISAQEHYKIGEKIAKSGFNKLVSIGNEGQDVTNGAKENGMSAEDIFLVEDAWEAEKILKELINPGELLLFKGGMYSKLGRLCKRFASDKSSLHLN